MDSCNTNSITYLSQVFTSIGGNLSSLNLNTDLPNSASLHSRLTRNQSAVGTLMQNILDNRNIAIEDIRQKFAKLEAEYEECKEENVDLNDHIYSIDVYMREKEAEAEKLQKEKDELETELNVIKSKVKQDIPSIEKQSELKDENSLSNTK